jgi:hypothetical protein
MGTDMSHCSSRFVAVIVHLLTLAKLDDDMATNYVIIRRIINLRRMYEEEIADLTFCKLTVQNFVTEVEDGVSQGNYI